MTERAVRVRFAPSPTGALHIGGVRTALYNYLFAKKHNGKFLLRIEDTDQTRYVEGAEEYIKNTLEWIGLQPDESPWIGGEHTPYRQSERKDTYKQYALQLVEKGFAYYAFDTKEEEDAMRKRLEEAGSKNFSYNALSRGQMKNSLTLSEAEVKTLIDADHPYVIRFKTPLKEEIRFQDMIRGWVMVHSNTLDDKVLMKSDGMPTYHLANVVDDYLMKISHVIRGEEWLPSAPLHVLLYRSFGWEEVMPKFAHLPLLLKPDLKNEKGQIIEKRHGKLSKRDADEMGFPIFPLDWQNSKGYKESGYIKEALINFLALLGWNDGTEKEIFTLDELIEAFSIERIHLGGAKFEIEKAKWFNQQYLKQKDHGQLAQELKNTLQSQSIHVSDENIANIITLMHDRVSFPDDFWKETPYLYNAPSVYDEKTITGKWTQEAVDFLKKYSEKLDITYSTPEISWKSDKIHDFLNMLIETQGLKLGKVMPALRVALTGLGNGPDLMLIQEIIGKEETQNRILKAIESLKDKVLVS